MNSSHDSKDCLWKPKVLVFACTWCAYIGNDLAGLERLPMDPGFRVIRVQCASRVEGDWIIRALASGIDGIMVMGCHLGGCRHQEANHHALKRLNLLRTLLECMGIDPRRLYLGWGMGIDAKTFRQLIHTFMEELRPLRPLGTDPPPSHKES